MWSSAQVQVMGTVGETDTARTGALSKIAIACSNSVSYTHLDVYKRQIQRSVIFLLSVLKTFASTTTTHIRTSLRRSRFKSWIAPLPSKTSGAAPLLHVKLLPRGAQ